MYSGMVARSTSSKPRQKETHGVASFMLDILPKYVDRLGEKGRKLLTAGSLLDEFPERKKVRSQREALVSTIALAMSQRPAHISVMSFRNLCGDLALRGGGFVVFVGILVPPSPTKGHTDWAEHVRVSSRRAEKARPRPRSARRETE